MATKDREAERALEREHAGDVARAVGPRIAEMVREGAPIPAACRRNGVRPSQWREWQQLADDAIVPWAEIVEAIYQAEADAHGRIASALAEQALTSTPAALAYLERRHPEEWRRPKDEVQVDVRAEVRSLTDAELVARLAALPEVRAAVRAAEDGSEDA